MLCEVPRSARAATTHAEHTALARTRSGSGWTRHSPRPRMIFDSYASDEGEFTEPKAEVWCLRIRTR